MPLDLSNKVLVFHDEFENQLNRYDNGSGLWSTASETGRIRTNSAYSVNLSGDDPARDGGTIGVDPFATQDGVLTVSSGRLTEQQKQDVKAILDASGESAHLDPELVEFYTGRMTTHDTWSQTYGYFEITARIVEGKGHWPAFWLVSEHIGDWPPEITIMEAYGTPLTGEHTWYSNRFLSAVHFNSVDSNGDPADIDIANPYTLDPNGNPTLPENRSALVGTESYSFAKTTDAMDRFGADIYNEFWTWSVEWTETEIVFYFGPDRDQLVETFRTPTPDDIKTPMSLIVNDQIGTRTGWFGEKGFSDFDIGDQFEVDSISVYAENPDSIVAVTAGQILTDISGDADIRGTAGDDTIRPGDGFDIISLGGGSDEVQVQVHTGHKIIEGFDSNDRLVLEGFRFADGDEIRASLTQVGDDVWLSQGRFGTAGPQTVILRDINVDAIAPTQIVSRWAETPDIWTFQTRIKTGLIQDNDGDGVVFAPKEGGRLTDNGMPWVKLYGSEVGDTYTIYSGRPVEIVEHENGGVDTIYTLASRTIVDNVENMVSISRQDGLILTGNDAANRITGSLWADTLDGAGGDDLLDLSRGGADTIRLYANSDHDTVLGFGKDDTLVLDGYSFADQPDLWSRFTFNGTDLTLAVDNRTTITFRDVESLSKGQVKAVFAGTDDIPYLPADAVAIADKHHGTDADEALQGSAADNVIFGNGGSDFIAGGAGNDRLYGGDGDDTLLGNAGNDLISAGAGRNIVRGGEGADRLLIEPTLSESLIDCGGVMVDSVTVLENLSFAEGDSIYLGNAFTGAMAGAGLTANKISTLQDLTAIIAVSALNDRSGILLVADNFSRHAIQMPGHENLFLSTEATPKDSYAVPKDAIFVAARNFGSDRDDVLQGSDANNIIFGQNGADFIAGGDGLDRLFGQAGNDTLRGGTGDDHLSGGTGSNILIGDAGADRFVFDAIPSHEESQLGASSFATIAYLPDLNFAQRDNLYFGAGFDNALKEAGLTAKKVSSLDDLKALARLGVDVYNEVSYIDLVADNGSHHAIGLAAELLW